MCKDVKFCPYQMGARGLVAHAESPDAILHESFNRQYETSQSFWGFGAKKLVKFALRKREAATARFVRLPTHRYPGLNLDGMFRGVPNQIRR